MTLIKKYVTWDANVIDPYNLQHPNASIDKLWSGVISFTDKVSDKECSLGNTATDKRFLGIIEYDDEVADVDTMERFMNKYSALHTFDEVSALEAMDLCNKWYPAPVGEADYFTLDVDSWTLIDGRPEINLI